MTGPACCDRCAVVCSGCEAVRNSVQLFAIVCNAFAVCCCVVAAAFPPPPVCPSVLMSGAGKWMGEGGGEGGGRGGGGTGRA